MASKWADTTSYSQGDKQRVPTTWSVKLGHYTLTVLCSHIYYPKQWICHFSPFLDTHDLKLKADTPKQNLAEAKRKALMAAHDTLQGKVMSAVEAANEMLADLHG